MLLSVHLVQVLTESLHYLLHWEIDLVDHKEKDIVYYSVRDFGLLSRTHDLPKGVSKARLNLLLCLH